MDKPGEIASVDNRKPHAVWLAVSGVVNGARSRMTNRYLTFRYKDRSGRPRLIRYETPDITGAGLDDELSRPLPQELPGRWPGELKITRMWVSPRATKKQREGCAVKGFRKNLGKTVKIVWVAEQIDLVGAPGLRGNPVNPKLLKKHIFPGTSKLYLLPRPGQKPRKGQKPYHTKLSFAYNYPERWIRLESTKRELRIGGHFYQNATHYTIRGTWKWSVCDKKGFEYTWARGTFAVRKRKP